MLLRVSQLLGWLVSLDCLKVCRPMLDHSLLQKLIFGLRPVLPLLDVEVLQVQLTTLWLDDVLVAQVEAHLPYVIALGCVNHVVHASPVAKLRLLGLCLRGAGFAHKLNYYSI